MTIIDLDYENTHKFQDLFQQARTISYTLSNRLDTFRILFLMNNHNFKYPMYSYNMIWSNY